MARIPSVSDGLLQGTAAGGAAGLAVGSPGWFAWLADDAARSFSYRSPSGVYTARKERRQRGGAYWVAYRTAAARQHKVLPGRPSWPAPWPTRRRCSGCWPGCATWARPCCWSST
jgi:LuxR family transcriptional regulator, maltose regulon positive regulatory protein